MEEVELLNVMVQIFLLFYKYSFNAYIILAIRQAIARGVVSYYQKCINSHICNHFNIDVNEQEKRDIKDALVTYDRSLLVSDPRRCEPKKFGGPAARARKQKSYRQRIYFVIFITNALMIAHH